MRTPCIAVSQRNLALKTEQTSNRRGQRSASARVRRPLARAHQYGCAVHRIQHDAYGVRVFFRTGQSVESAEAGYVVCAVPFSTLGSVGFLPALTSEKPAVIEALPYQNVTRIYLQSRDRYWTREELSGFAETDHPMEIWDSTYGQPGTRGILML